MGKACEVMVKRINHKFSDNKAVDSLIKYILADAKRKGRKQYAGGKGVDYLDWKRAVKQFKSIQRCYGKESGRRIYHMVISFPEDYDDLYEIYMFGERIMDQFFEEYQCVFGLHEDTDNLHIHFVWNAVNYKNGKKWHASKKEWENIVEEIQKGAAEIL